MVASLEKIKGNSDFHEIVDFLASSSIHHALTVSPPIYTLYIEQFWNTASSQTVNDVKQINATIDSKAVVVTEASIRISLIFNDADGTPCLTNEAIFQNLALMGYEGGHKYDRAESALNLQALSVLCTNLSNRVLALESIKDAQAAEISALKSRIKKLEKKCKPSISQHRAWLKSVNRLSMKKRFRKKEYVSKQGRKKSKPESTLDDSTVFDDQDADHGMEYMETKEVVDEGKQSGETKEVKLTDDTEVVEDKSSAQIAKMLDNSKTGKYRHNQLNKKTFEEIQTLYIKEQERDADFVPIGSERDEKMIDKMNKKVAGMDEEEVPKEPESTKVEVKQEGREENIRKRSVPDEEEEIDYEVLGTRFIQKQIDEFGGQDGSEKDL
ncbi:hypothetical protein Tco_1539746 [Tanacetum coccineum]